MKTPEVKVLEEQPGAKPVEAKEKLSNVEAHGDADVIEEQKKSEAALKRQLDKTAAEQVLQKKIEDDLKMSQAEEKAVLMTSDNKEEIENMIKKSPDRFFMKKLGMLRSIQDSFGLLSKDKKNEILTKVAQEVKKSVIEVMERASRDPEYRKELDAMWLKKFLNKKDPATDVSPADKVASWGDFSFPTDKMEDLKMKARAFVDNYKGSLGRNEEKKQLDYQNDGMNSYSNAEYSSNIQ